MGSVFKFLIHGFSVVFTFQNIAAALIGSILGIFVGAMPGIGSLAGITLLLPLTYKFNPTTAIVLLGSLYYSNMYGGAYSAILLNIPGDSPAIMTSLDGYPMSVKRKRPGQALMTANTASFLGGTIGILILTFLAPQLASFGLKFGPSEMTAILLIAMTSISWLVGENPIKGIVVTCFGILLASMGMDTLSGSPRFNFGSMYLLGGIPFTSFIIGAIGFAQIIELMTTRHEAVDADFSQKLTVKGSLLTKDDFKRLLLPSIRSGIVGTFVGVLPGAGATTGAFIGYSMQKNFKNKYELGSGTLEGVAASEAANNAAAAGAFAPLLALGIPGSGTGAVLLGGLMMWGLNPGPLLFQKDPDFAWGMIASLYVANVLTALIGIALIPFLLKILSVPTRVLIPIIAVVCIVGSYSATYSMYGVIVMLLSGVVAYLFNKNGFSAAPMLLSFVLAPLLESNMRKAFVISGGSLKAFFLSPLATILMIIFFAFIITPIVKSLLKKGKNNN